MPNLMSILSDYGVSAEKGAVNFDYEAAAKKEAEENKDTANAEESEEKVEYPDNNLVETQISPSHASLSNLYGYSVPMLNANHIDVASNLDSSFTVTALLTTDKDCFIEGVENSTGAKTVAVVVEKNNGDSTTEITWYTGAETFDGDKMQTINSYAATYSILWSIDEPKSQIDEIAPKLVAENYLDMTPTVVYILLVIMIVIIPCALVIIGALARSKFKKNPFAPKEEATDQNAEKPEESKEPEENTEE